MVAEGWLTSKVNYTEDGAQKSNTYHLIPLNIGATSDCRGATTDDRGCNERLQGVQRQVAGGATTDCTISLVKSLDKSLVKITPIVPCAFDGFYGRYPRKAGKQSAAKAWKKLNPDDALIERIFSDLKSRVELGEWDIADGKAFIPHPATYLNQARWEDEVTPRHDFKPSMEQQAAKTTALLKSMDEDGSWM